MNDQERTICAARGEAGARALKAISDYGDVTGSAIIRGNLEAYLLACAALHGWSATLSMVRAQAVGRYVPPIGEKLRLVHDAEPPINKSNVQHSA